MNRQTRLFVGPLAIMGLLVATAGCGALFGPSLQGSGVEKMETRAVGAFTEIEVSNAIELEVTIGPAADLVVSADDNLLPHLHTDVSGNRLRIYSDQNYSSKLGVKVLATVPELNALVGSGAARIGVAGVESHEFLLDLSGASHCEFTGEAETMEVKLSGASHATLTGSATILTLENSGASRLNAREFTADRVSAELSGASTADVHAQAELIVEVSGASTLRYTGEPPQVKGETSGASTLVKQ